MHGTFTDLGIDFDAVIAPPNPQDVLNNYQAIWTEAHTPVLDVATPEITFAHNRAPAETIGFMETTDILAQERMATGNNIIATGNPTINTYDQYQYWGNGGLTTIRANREATVNLIHTLDLTVIDHYGNRMSPFQIITQIGRQQDNITLDYDLIQDVIRELNTALGGEVPGLQLALAYGFVVHCGVIFFMKYVNTAEVYVNAVFDYLAGNTMNGNAMVMNVDRTNRLLNTYMNTNPTPFNIEVMSYDMNEFLSIQLADIDATITAWGDVIAGTFIRPRTEEYWRQCRRDHAMRVHNHLENIPVDLETETHGGGVNALRNARERARIRDNDTINNIRARIEEQRYAIDGRDLLLEWTTIERTEANANQGAEAYITEQIVEHNERLANTTTIDDPTLHTRVQEHLNRIFGIEEPEEEPDIFTGVLQYDTVAPDRLATLRASDHTPYQRRLLIEAWVRRANQMDTPPEDLDELTAYAQETNTEEQMREFTLNAIRTMIEDPETHVSPTMIQMYTYLGGTVVQEETHNPMGDGLQDD